MFSIHCKVLRVGRQKKEESILVQNRGEKENDRLRDSPQKSPPVSCKQSLFFFF